ncbi:MAG: hypothetical protein GF350_14645 [Chitinivibrionales bacterium]|nr:hypothetical protein [Chitinivibrionales bacterium]
MKQAIIGLCLIFAVKAIALDLPDTVSGEKDFCALFAQEDFTPGTLFDYINGGAGVYLDAGAQECHVRSYGPAKDTNLELEVACYRMSTPIQAFGLFRDLYAGLETIGTIGTESVQRERQVVFWKDRWYVEIADKSSPPADDSTVLDFARAFSNTLRGTTTLPPRISWLPKKNLKSGSERYTEQNFLARSFLNGVVSGEYQSACTLFVMKTSDKPAARNVIEKIKNTFSAYEDTTGNTEISERIMVLLHGSAIIGVVGTCKKERKFEFAETCRDRLINYKQ